MAASEFAFLPTPWFGLDVCFFFLAKFPNFNPITAIHQDANQTQTRRFSSPSSAEDFGTEMSPEVLRSRKLATEIDGIRPSRNGIFFLQQPQRADPKWREFLLVIPAKYLKTYQKHPNAESFAE